MYHAGVLLPLQSPRTGLHAGGGLLLTCLSVTYQVTEKGGMGRNRMNLTVHKSAERQKRPGTAQGACTGIPEYGKDPVSEAGVHKSALKRPVKGKDRVGQAPTGLLSIAPLSASDCPLSNRDLFAFYYICQAALCGGNSTWIILYCLFLRTAAFSVHNGQFSAKNEESTLEEVQPRGLRMKLKNEDPVKNSFSTPSGGGNQSVKCVPVVALPLSCCLENCHCGKRLESTLRIKFVLQGCSRLRKAAQSDFLLKLKDTQRNIHGTNNSKQKDEETTFAGDKAGQSTLKNQQSGNVPIIKYETAVSASRQLANRQCAHSLTVN